jgi:HlyD family secretion protein
VYANEPGGRPGQQGVQIEEGAAVRERQSIIRLPDLSRMQVKVLVNETKVDLLRLGMRARVRIQDREFQGTVVSVANQAEPGGFFSSAVKDYATMVRIDGESSGLRPGMTAVVEILVANLKDVLSVPVQSVVEQDDKFYCWVDNGGRPERCQVVLGVTNDTVVEIKEGLKDQDVVLLNPRAVVADAREEVRAPEKVDIKKKFGEQVAAPESAAGGSGAGEQRRSKEGPGGGRRGGFDLMQFDKDGDKKVSMDEAPDRMRSNFDMIDTNHDGFIDTKEAAAMKRRMQQQGGPGGPPRP